MILCGTTFVVPLLQPAFAGCFYLSALIQHICEYALIGYSGCDKMNELLQILPKPYQEAIARLSETERKFLEEIRLRVDRPAMTVVAGKEMPLPLSQCVSSAVLEQILGQATRHSFYQATTLKEGYLTISGGHRIGVGGTVILHDDMPTGMRHITSLNLRIAREFPGVAHSAALSLSDGRESTLIAGPPGSGKTTLLRDLVRQLSISGRRICVVDERGEIAAETGGKRTFDLGPHTDVISGCRKENGILMAIRNLTPDWIALDEITCPEDASALIQASYCGAGYLACVHIWNREDLYRRPIYRLLISEGIFRNLLIMDKQKQYRMERIGKYDKGYGNDAAPDRNHFYGYPGYRQYPENSRTNGTASAVVCGFGERDSWNNEAAAGNL